MTQQAGRKHPGVVHYQQIAGTQEVGKIRDDVVSDLARCSIERQ